MFDWEVKSSHRVSQMKRRFGHEDAPKGAGERTPIILPKMPLSFRHHSIQNQDLLPSDLIHSLKV